MNENPNDFFLARNSDGIYDFVIEDGQFKTVSSFDTAFLVTMFCERRADVSEVPAPEYRRGWLGNLLLFDDGFELGSKLWLLYQERNTDTVLNKAVDYLNNALQYMVDDGHVESFTVVGSPFFDSNGIRNGIRLTIKYIVDKNITESRYYELWQNTPDRGRIVNEDAVHYILYSVPDMSEGAEEGATIEGKILLLGDPDNGALRLKSKN